MSSDIAYQHRVAWSSKAEQPLPIASARLGVAERHIAVECQLPGRPDPSGDFAALITSVALFAALANSADGDTLSSCFS